MRKILTLLFGLMISSISVASDGFTDKGAFGYTLGEHLDFEKAQRSNKANKIKITKQEKSILFSSKTGFHDFDQYYVASTPRTNTIFKIGAMEQTKSNQECMSERKSLIDYFENLYKFEHKKIPMKESYIAKDVIIGKNISVTVVCNISTNRVVIEFSNLATSRLQWSESK